MIKSFKDKIVWIVGASSGIGEALAFALISMKAKVILSSRREEELIRIKNSSEYPDNVKILSLDLFDFSTFKIDTHNAFSFFNRIDYVFLNGGTSARGYVSELPMEIHERIMRLNYFSYVALAKEILPEFKKQGSGHFIVTSSVMGKIGTPKRSAYAASKHALHGFFDCLRAEMATNNIKVTVLTPGYISTDISLHTLMPDGKENSKKSEDINNGLLASKAANQILKAVKDKKSEVYIGKKLSQEHLGLYLMKFFPDILFKFVRKKVPD